MGAGVVHFEINVRDQKKGVEFYSTLFDWKIDSNNPLNYGLVDTGLKLGIMGGIGETRGESPPSVMFYVQVEDVQGYLDKAVRLGGRVMVPVTEIPDMVTFGQFADPEGNIIGLIQGPQTEPETPKPKRRAGAKKKVARRRPRVKSKRAPRRSGRKKRSR